ncbi:fumarylacetoacetate hydrolase family protein [Spelaeicoccus albus]|uniref:Regulator of RNase E activity RraA/2-keto-4-pentenoate hydratase/2-oxohepta-3-ene-1,7-dioic acid hydratase in catechol pathway n=1 Tax=Spelaeicoccus albus TaxID=1280376 RepID=A0A7Z0ABB5_9MICO|nr:fumarylacetoacetate hydrolase family protein [Spelaeicoccus albus]NYI66508.1 regulator of RNase E activity RraA/2-keto-4-pentenoate hydratase/2-oxohepta-3-ene-1,7-dioic acid hydratase in catechol pathway [Spelaeicoccus albus]
MSQPDPITAHFGHRPGKIYAVHLNYPSRAAQRGRTPAAASYFFKPTSSLAGPGEVARPQGTELLGFEGEVALVIGTSARNVAPDAGWSHVGWVTASNDLGLYDIRYADKGSNVRSKGGDGYTPVGPELIDAHRIDPAGLRIRTWRGDDLIQDDTTADLLFDFGHLVADLSRFATLEPGDVILTGTPAGASVAEPGQTVTVEVNSIADESITSGKLTTTVVHGPALGDWGSAPKVDDQVRADAWGTPSAASSDSPQAPRGADGGSGPLTPELRERIKGVAVATLSAQMRKRGFNQVSIDGVRPLVAGTTIIGTARTLRFVPFRKDLFAESGGGFNAQKQAIDSVGDGDVLVMDARGRSDAGTLGDILAMRAKVNGAAGVITDGAIRDAAAVEEVGMPVYSSGFHPAVLGRVHVPWETDVTVSCGGASVQPGDVIIGNDDGILVIPPALIDEVVASAEQQEDEETFILEQVKAGRSVEGLYPLNKQSRAEYEAWAARRAEDR